MHASTLTANMTNSETGSGLEPGRLSLTVIDQMSSKVLKLRRSRRDITAKKGRQFMPGTRLVASVYNHYNKN